MKKADDGKCLECYGHGYFSLEPSFIYGKGKSKCKACDGTGLLTEPTVCKYCGVTSYPLGFNKSTEPNDLTFSKVREANVKRFKEIWPNEQDWTSGDWLGCVLKELGEVAHLLMDRRGNKEDSKETFQQDLSHELADVFLYLDLLAHREGIDLEKAVKEKFNEKSSELRSQIYL